MTFTSHFLVIKYLMCLFMIHCYFSTSYGIFSLVLIPCVEEALSDLSSVDHSPQGLSRSFLNAGEADFGRNILLAISYV